ncbi:MAG: PD-(D/E)XK nuclease family transposase, partial [Fusobacteriaceae bacterium]
MCTSLLDPKMDFIFKSIFGNEKEKSVLLSFLNSAIKSES